MAHRECWRFGGHVVCGVGCGNEKNRSNSLTKNNVYFVSFLLINNIYVLIIKRIIKTAPHHNLSHDQTQFGHLLGHRVPKIPPPQYTTLSITLFHNRIISNFLISLTCIGSGCQRVGALDALRVVGRSVGIVSTDSVDWSGVTVWGWRGRRKVDGEYIYENSCGVCFLSHDIGWLTIYV